MIRPAALGDLDALERLETDAFPGDRLSRRSLRYYVSAPTAVFLIIDWERTLAGDALVAFRQGSKIARLYSLAVAPGLTGRGLGQALLNASEAAAGTRKRGALRLEVREDNAAAIALYRRSGYHEYGRELDFYEDGASALRFEKAIDS